MKTCCIKNCHKEVKAYSMCSQHAERMRLYKNPLRENRYAIKHGLTKHPLYRLWKSIKSRCYNKGVGQKNYGQRGIAISDEFRNDPKVFIDYIQKLPRFSERLSEKLTIDRIDNDKGYERGNLRWATKSEQAFNRRISPRNTSGYTGVSFSPSYRGKKKYSAYVKENGKHKHLGWFMTPEEANQVVLEYKEKNV